MTLLASVLDDANLFEGWLKVRANAGAAGVDGQTIDQFGVNVFGRLQTLADQVRRHQYRPQSLLRVGIPKPDGRLRYLAIPTVRDRVLQSATTRVITPLLEAQFEHASFAYRAGRSVAMAVARVAHYRDQGFQWVVDADIQGFFDEVDHGFLLGKLRTALADNSIVELVGLWLAATLQAEGEQPWLLTKGIPQGSPISPVLANLYLDELDEAILGESMRLVRFADDFLILCKDEAEAERALALTSQVIEHLRLRLNLEKTRVVTFNDGFRFLGVDFIRNLMKPANPAHAHGLIPDAHQRAQAAKAAADLVIEADTPSPDDESVSGTADGQESGSGSNAGEMDAPSPPRRRAGGWLQADACPADESGGSPASAESSASRRQKRKSRQIPAENTGAPR